MADFSLKNGHLRYLSLHFLPPIIGRVTRCLSAFALLYPMMLSDFVSDNTRTRAGSAADQRPFTAAGKGADRAPPAAVPPTVLAVFVMTLIVGILPLSHARVHSRLLAAPKPGPNRWAAAPSAT